MYLREEILRIDHRFNDKFAIFGHYMKDDVSQTYGTSLWSGSNVPERWHRFDQSGLPLCAACHILDYADDFERSGL